MCLTKELIGTIIAPNQAVPISSIIGPFERHTMTLTHDHPDTAHATQHPDAETVTGSDRDSGEARARANTGVLLVAALVTGLAAGFFWTYQFSVIRGLAIVDDRTYVETFRAINATIRNAWFGIVFFGAIPILTMALVFNWSTTRARRALIGAGLAGYVAAFAITAIGNVPLNDELAEHTTTDAVSFDMARQQFEGSWNDLNLIRTIASIVAFVFCLLAIASPQRRQR